MVSKYDLQFLANNYFIMNGVSPLHPITPDDCHNFLVRCYNYTLEIPVRGQQAYNELLNYIMQTAQYYGFDIVKVIKYAKTTGSDQVYFLYMRQHFGIEANADVKKFIKDTFSEIGNTLAGSIWGLIKPFIPLFLLGIGAIMLTNKAISKPKN